jgi:hypothetical protein
MTLWWIKHFLKEEASRDYDTMVDNYSQKTTTSMMTVTAIVAALALLGVAAVTIVTIAQQ